MTSTKAYKSIRFGDIHDTKAYEFIGSGVIHGPKAYKLTGVWCHAWPLNPINSQGLVPSTAPNPINSYDLVPSMNPTSGLSGPLAFSDSRILPLGLGPETLRIRPNLIKSDLDDLRVEMFSTQPRSRHDIFVSPPCYMGSPLPRKNQQNIHNSRSVGLPTSIPTSISRSISTCR